MWSPMSTVFSMEPLGIRRLCATALSTTKSARKSQTHETISRRRRWRIIFERSIFASSRSTGISAATMRLHFELDELGRINAGVTRGAEPAVVVLDGGAEILKRKIAERVGVNELTNLLDGLLRADEFELR